MQLLVFIYSVTLFAGAFLLFLVQPMVGKMLLAPLGGSPAVWTTCMLFFQSALLAGYSYAHLSVGLLGARRQAFLTLAVIALALLALPLAVGGGEPSYEHPTLWLLGQLLAGAGLLFFVVSAGAPTLQSWFHSAGHPEAEDPYFLYAASNAGSLVALLGYPLIVEPLLPLAAQAAWWGVLFCTWTVLVAICSWTLFRSDPPRGANPAAAPKPTGAAVAWWIGLAFVPSSLMLGVTTFMTHDIAAVPLLWVVPLALYLATFILVFKRRPLLSHSLMLRLFPYAVLLMLVLTFGGSVPSVHLLLVIPLAGFFCISMVCHGELFRRRPHPSQLTAFYFWLAVGGALGGIFNAVLAPLLFDSVAEYPLVIILACLLVAPGSGRSFTRADWIAPALLLASAIVIEIGTRQLEWVAPNTVRMLLAAAIVLISFSWRERRFRFTLGAVALLVAGAFHGRLERGAEQFVERNFYGIKRVVVSGDLLNLWHGNTLHGAQFMSQERRGEPLAYYHRSGPLGDFFASLPPSSDRHVAAVGLGAGSIAAYAEPGQKFTFYEIDPTVGRLAAGGDFFSFLAQSAGQVEVVIGDGRLEIARAPGHAFDLIVLDAFSSDSVPTHLLTIEALDIYLDRLKPEGLMAFHISNRYLDLRRLIGSLAARQGLAAVVRKDETIALDVGHAPSTWVVMARTRDQLGTLGSHPDWSPLAGDPTATVWTDQFSNVLDLLNW